MTFACSRCRATQPRGVFQALRSKLNIRNTEHLPLGILDVIVLVNSKGHSHREATPSSWLPETGPRGYPRLFPLLRPTHTGSLSPLLSALPSKNSSDLSSPSISIAITLVQDTILLSRLQPPDWPPAFYPASPHHSPPGTRSIF